MAWPGFRASKDAAARKFVPLNGRATGRTRGCMRTGVYRRHDCTAGAGKQISDVGLTSTIAAVDAPRNVHYCRHEYREDIMTKILFAISLATLCAACANPPSTPETEFNRLAVQVENEIGLADKAGFLWRDTERYLEEARQARKQGREEEAVKLAQKALRQAQLAQQQAKDNANAGPTYPNP
jgi:hypothetical protein